MLSCIANLSNDEVFTPPHLANQVLDSITEAWSVENSGANIWSDETVTFLDPCTKSGVFLREITKRLINGLEAQFPDLERRVEHILTKQVFGIGLTRITSLLARRSLYCSKDASGEHSIVKSFDNDAGHIWFEPLKHTWKGGKCQYCGASKKTYDRDTNLESHAYAFIHTDNLKSLGSEFFASEMQFDVVLGNPPYQLNDGGGVGSSAVPIYQHFVTQAMKLHPKFMTFIIPSRWFTGGRGLDSFREQMLKDKRIKIIHDFPNASDCFPNVEIKGGVCYFLWGLTHDDDCTVTLHNGDQENTLKRPLLEEDCDVYIRYNDAIPIFKKIRAKSEESFSELVSSNDPFGFDVREKGSYKRVKPDFKLEPFKNSCEFYYNGWREKGIGHIDKSAISKNIDWVEKYKILIPKAWGVGNPANDKIRPEIFGKNTCCTETYLVVGPSNNRKELENIVSFMNTKFFHFCLALIKNTQNTSPAAYSFTPVQDWSKSWTDEKLYKKYELTESEIQVIESMIWPGGSADE